MTMKYVASVALAVTLLTVPAPTRAASPSPELFALSQIAGGPSQAALTAALAAYDRARAAGKVVNATLLTVIDYTKPSTEPRLWVLDLASRSILYRELVAHGRGSGENIARTFSNVAESHMTSLGLFVTDDAYVGKNGYSLRLRGLDPGLNDRAYVRAIVIHGASYVSQAVAEKLGRLGRSWGCPAVRTSVAKPLIDTIKHGTVVFAYGPGTGADTH